MRRVTRFLRSYFHTERDALRSALYHTVRAGHLIADKTHHVDRETLDHYTHIASHDSHAAMQRLEASITERRLA